MNSTGQYYYNASWYDPQIGRFTTEDPIRSGLNWYAYANNNPLRFVDPTGLRPIVGEGIDGQQIIANHDGTVNIDVKVVKGEGDDFFNDKFEVYAGGAKISSDDVHAEKYLDSNNLRDFTLPEDDGYVLTLLPESQSFDRPLLITNEDVQGPLPSTLGIKWDDSFLVHPNEITKESTREAREASGRPNGPFSTPQSLGCIVFEETEKYTDMRDTLEAFGKEDYSTIPMELKNK